MNWLDYVLLGILVLSVSAGFMKGLVREVFSLGGVVLGVLFALMFSGQVQPWLEQWIPSPSAAYAAALVAIFVATMIAADLISRLISNALKLVKLNFVNRILGGVFGILRAVLIAMVVVLGAQLFLEPGHPVLSESKTVPVLGEISAAIAPLLPEEVRDALDEQLEKLQEIRESKVI